MHCHQLVTIDNCCNPSECGKPAVSEHAASGRALCAEHYGNGLKYVIDGTWNVAGKQLPFPEGWVALEVAAAAVSALAPAEEARPSGLVIDTGALSPSGLVIERRDS